MIIVVEQIFPSLTWRIRQESMYPDESLDFVKLTDDFDGIHFGLYADHKLTGVASLFENDNTYQFRKLAVLPESQHKGYGTELLTYILDFCKIQKAAKIWCNARVNAKEFYTKFGFHETDRAFFKDGHHFVVMEMEF